MNIINRTKGKIGIDPRYDVMEDTVYEVDKATDVFIAAHSHYVQFNSKDCAIRCALADVWHAAKQYYAQHPQELYKCFVL